MQIESCLGMAIMSSLGAITMIALACSDIIHEITDQNYYGDGFYMDLRHMRNTASAHLQLVLFLFI